MIVLLHRGGRTDATTVVKKNGCHDECCCFVELFGPMNMMRGTTASSGLYKEV